MRYSKLLAVANFLQAIIPILVFAVVIFIASWPSLAHPEAPVLAPNIFIPIGLVMVAVTLSVWILSDRSSGQEERIQKLEDEVERLRKLLQD